MHPVDILIKNLYLYRLFISMRIFWIILFFITASLLYSSCQRELFFDGISSGKLKQDVSGNCLPIVANGIFKADTVLNNTNFIEVQADVTQSGTYNISSDTINGYSFNGTGTVVQGINTIRLFARGKPKISGLDNFKVTYGTSTCNFKVNVSNTAFAVFTLGGTPNSCTGVFINGNYMKQVALTSDNTVTIEVNVTVPGRYMVNTSTTNGFQFSANGIFTSTGIQSVTLKGTGTPVKDDTTIVTVTNIVSNCYFKIIVSATADGKAIFSFDGTPGNCINAVVNGSFYAGILTTANNTVVLNVSVSKTGTYTINTNVANGITFSSSGVFSSTGPQTVILLPTGAPIRSESTAFIPNTGTQACDFLVDIQPLPPPAIFTLSGAPGACTPVTVNGFYIHAKPLDAANNVIIQVDVSAVGSYSISTNLVNGFSFSASGVFTTTGLQNIMLKGNGVPLAIETSIISPGHGTTTCSFNVIVQ